MSNTTGALQIRSAEHNDSNAILALWHDVGLTTPSEGGYDHLRSWQTPHHGSLFVGTVDDRIIATIHAGHDGRHGWLHRLAVDPGYRGQGHERKMVKAAQAWHTARNVAETRIILPNNSPKLRELFGQLGYSAETRSVMVLRQGDRTPSELPETTVGHISTLVTYLEMRTPPDRPAAVAPDHIATVLSALEQPNIPYYRFLYNTVGAPWSWVERRLQDDATLAAEITAPGVEIFVLYSGGAPAGYGELHRGLRPDEVNLAYFGLMSEFIGRGLGRYFLDAMIDIAWSSDPKRVWVHTCDLDHSRALDTYKRAGFKVYGQQQESLPDPRAAGLPLPPGRDLFFD